MSIEYLDEVAQKIHDMNERLGRGHEGGPEFMSALATLALEIVRAVRDLDQQLKTLEDQSAAIDE